MAVEADDQPAGLGPPPHLPEDFQRIAQMHEERMAHGHIESTIGKRRVMSIRLHEGSLQIGPWSGQACVCEQGGRHIDAGIMATWHEASIEERRQIAPPTA